MAYNVTIKVCDTFFKCVINWSYYATLPLDCAVSVSLSEPQNSNYRNEKSTRSQNVLLRVSVMHASVESHTNVHASLLGNICKMLQCQTQNQELNVACQCLTPITPRRHEMLDQAKRTERGYVSQVWDHEGML